ncbi:hypothetical protein PENSPDRAFT_147708 [Peniophora sp. CONT]|nr:hypothetical protein PENSPDRAFT_147708 [Peniophora sp. CONT]
MRSCLYVSGIQCLSHEVEAKVGRLSPHLIYLDITTTPGEVTGIDRALMPPLSHVPLNIQTFDLYRTLITSALLRTLLCLLDVLIQQVYGMISWYGALLVLQTLVSFYDMITQTCMVYSAPSREPEVQQL